MSVSRDQDRLATPTYPSLVRPILIAGVERMVMIPFVGLVVSLLIAFRLNWVTPMIALVLVVFVLPVLRRINKRDGQAWAVLAEHVRVSGFYPGQARPEAVRKARLGGRGR